MAPWRFPSAGVAGVAGDVAMVAGVAGDVAMAAAAAVVVVAAALPPWVPDQSPNCGDR
jgi:hypothetical protein